MMEKTKKIMDFPILRIEDLNSTSTIYFLYMYIIVKKLIIIMITLGMVPSVKLPTINWLLYSQLSQLICIPAIKMKFKTIIQSTVSRKIQ